MPEATISWRAEALWEQLVPLLPGLSVEVVPRASSTNHLLLDRARAVPERRGPITSPGALDEVQLRHSVDSAPWAGPARPAPRGGLSSPAEPDLLKSASFGRRAVDLQPCLLVAEHQTAGRGRQGRRWQAAPGASLTFSLGLALLAGDWSGLSLAVGVALAEALDPALGAAPRVGLKWPNDLWLLDRAAGSTSPGRKLGGILIETVAAGTQRLAVIGVGLNVMPFRVGDSADTGFASVRELDPAATAPAVLAQIARPLVLALTQFEREGFAAFAERYAARDLLRGKRVRTTAPDATEGIARGVSPHGELLIETAEGTQAIASGEVSVRPVADDAA
ncbi:MAG TPA: biotin--[acetyl-CoA-carboxylase] ligase [Burkholderiaceae bacterium]|nr:biotin--[acetyl-CoA-carboxylase] ligase [Burkholderiaceae bacterium]